MLTELPIQYPDIFKRLEEETPALSALAEASDRLTDSATPEQWLEVYQKGLEVTDLLGIGLRNIQEALLATRQAEPDVSSLRARLVDGPNRLRDQLPSRIKQVSQERRTVWLDRLQRQSAYLQKQSVPLLTRLGLQETSLDKRMRISYQQESILILERWLEESLQRWEEQVHSGYLAELQEAADRLVADVRKTLDAALPPLSVQGDQNQLLPPSPPSIADLSREMDAPGFFAEFFKFLRTNFYTVAFLGTMVLGSLLTRREVLMYASPPLLVIGIFWVRKEQRQQRQKEWDQARQALSRELEQRVVALFEASRGELAANLNRQREFVQAATESWIETYVQPQVRNLDAQFSQKAIQAQLVHQRLNESLNQVSSIRNKLSQSLRVELTRRTRQIARELREAHDASPSGAA